MFFTEIESTQCLCGKYLIITSALFQTNINALGGTTIIILTSWTLYFKILTFHLCISHNVLSASALCKLFVLILMIVKYFCMSVPLCVAEILQCIIIKVSTHNLVP